MTTMSCTKSSRLVLWAALFVGILTLAACGGSGSGGGSSTNEASNRTVSGFVGMNSAVENATVEIHELQQPDSGASTTSASSVRDSLVAGPTVTDNNGKWSATLPASSEGPWIVTATGGSTTINKSGQTLNLTSRDKMRAVITADDPKVNVTPVTESVTQRVTTRLAGASTPGLSAKGVVKRHRNRFESQFGFDPVSTRPADGITSQSTTTARKVSSSDQRPVYGSPQADPQANFNRGTAAEGAATAASTVERVAITGIRHAAMAQVLVDLLDDDRYADVRAQEGRQALITDVLPCDAQDGNLDGLGVAGQPCSPVIPDAGLNETGKVVEKTNEVATANGHPEASVDAPKVELATLDTALAAELFLAVDSGAVDSGDTPNNPGFKKYEYLTSPYRFDGIPAHAGIDFRSRGSSLPGNEGLHWVQSPIGGTIIKTTKGDDTFGLVVIKSDSNNRTRTLLLAHLHTPCKIDIDNLKNVNEKDDLTGVERDKRVNKCGDFQQGDTIKKGDIVGLTGDTTKIGDIGPHLHVEYRTGVQDNLVGARSGPPAEETLDPRRLVFDTVNDNGDKLTDVFPTNSERREFLNSIRGTSASSGSSGESGRLKLAAETLPDGTRVRSGATRIKRIEFVYQGNETINDLEARLQSASDSLNEIESTFKIGTVKPGDRFVVQEVFEVASDTTENAELTAQWQFFGKPENGSEQKLNVVFEASTVNVFQLKVTVSGSELIENGNFETGDLTGWETVDAGSGDFFVISGGSTPLSGFSVPSPPEGAHWAMTDQSDPGHHIIWQTLTVPECGRPILKLEFYVANRASQWHTPDTLSFETDPNQQFRVSLRPKGSRTLDASAGVGFDVNDISFTSLEVGPKTVEKDLSSIKGRTVRLQISEVDTESFHNLAVDNVRVIVEDNTADNCT